jgi:hypothetical protein
MNTVVLCVILVGRPIKTYHDIFRAVEPLVRNRTGGIFLVEGAVNMTNDLEELVVIIARQ